MHKKNLWFLTLMDTKTLVTISPDAFNDCSSLQYLTISDHSITTLNFENSFPILKQLVIAYNPIEAVNCTWYQSLPNAAIYLYQYLVYKVPGEPRFATCFDNFDQLTVTTTEEITTTPPPTVTCKFNYHRTFGYTGTLTRVYSDEFAIAGTHLSGKSDSDVTGVIFIKSKLSRISPRIFSKFPFSR
jgi:hypothetical protein